MKVYDYLIENYELNKPILITGLNIDGMSYVNLRKQLSRLVEMKLLEKYSQGVYYLPKDTILGKSKLAFEDVINQKYISNGDDVYGFYSGLSFLNKLGISTQIPFTYEIVTNKETSRKRTVTINNRSVILRKAYLIINKDNVMEMQFLDFVNNSSIEVINNNYELLKSYINKYKLKKELILELLKYFPAKASKKLIEGKLLDEFI